MPNILIPSLITLISLSLYLRVSRIFFRKTTQLCYYCYTALDGKLTKIYERKQQGGGEPLMKGPETILFSNDGTLIALTEEGKLISLTDFEEAADDEYDNSTATKILTAKSTLVADLGVGRPLGGKFHPKENTVYVADAHLGLLRLKLDENDGNKNKKNRNNKRNQATPADSQTTKNKVELIASRVYDNGEWTQIKYCNDVVIGPKTGIVYFTDCKFLFFFLYVHFKLLFPILKYLRI